MQEKSKNRVGYMSILFIIWLGCCVLMVGFGTYKVASVRYKYAFYERTTGYVYDYDSKNEDDNNLYCARYTYEVDGVTYTVSDDSYSSSLPKVGKEQTIYYNRENPQEASSGKDRDSGVILMIVGVSLGLIAVGIIIPRYAKYIMGTGIMILGMGFLGIAKSDFLIVNIVLVILAIIGAVIFAGGIYDSVIAAKKTNSHNPRIPNIVKIVIGDVVVLLGFLFLGIVKGIFVIIPAAVIVAGGVFLLIVIKGMRQKAENPN